MSGGSEKKTHQEIVAYLRSLAEMSFSEEKAEQLRRVAEQERAVLEQRRENFGRYSQELGQQNFGFAKGLSAEQWKKAQQAQRILEEKRKQLGIDGSRQSKKHTRQLPSKLNAQELVEPVEKKKAESPAQRQQNSQKLRKRKKRGRRGRKSESESCRIERMETNTDRRINPYEEKIILCIASAAEHFKEWIRITQVAMLAILKVHLNARMSKPTLCKYLELLEEKGYIERQRLIHANGRGTMRKATCYRLLPLAMKVIERNAKLVKKLLKRFKKIRKRVQDWAKKLFGTETPIRVNPVEYLLSIGYTLLHLRKKRACVAR